MSYTIRSTDGTKTFIVEDGDKDQNQLSITLIGKKASGYAEYVSENFLHLLENYSNIVPPNNPTEGQLWFDISDQFNKKLKVNNGIGWKPVNGVYQQEEQPSNADKGDIWVNTAKAQVFITLDGSSWTLVGPSFSSVLKSGSYPEEIRDINGDLHTVVKNYINDEVIEIVSNTQFTPQQKISGFTSIKPGINLSTNNNAALNATSFAAENIVVTAPNRLVVSGNSFVRNDVNGSINGVLNLKQGLTVGFDPTFVVEKTGNDSNVFTNLSNGGSFRFRIRSQENTNEILTLSGLTTGAVDSRPKVGINKNNPEVELDVVGSARFSGTVTITTNADEALVIAGSAVFGKAVSMTSTATFNTTASFRSSIELGIENDPAFKNLIVPLTTNRYNIGSSNRRFNEVYSSRFFGDLKGTADAASSLTTVAIFNIAGDIQSSGFSYSGLGGISTFVSSATTQLVSRHPSLSSVSDNDELLVSVRPATYISIPATGSENGTGASFNIQRADGVYTSVVLNGTGTNYVIDDVLTISGNLLGGQSPANDIRLQVKNVTGVGNIIPGGFIILSGTAVSGLNKTTKSNLLADIAEFLIPPGTILPFAGPFLPSAMVDKWLFCDGAVVDRFQYPRLFAAIGYTYGRTLLSSQFFLPDLRGRMIVGYDDMSNGLLSSTGPANRVPEAVTPVNTQGINPPPTGGATTATNGVITNQFGAVDSGIRANVMNPYMGMNYIIKV
jgi:microcystin-dependent protein